ncbi:MAG TPA: right-handed parallel beta-helix repeat-containing protein, partial [Candidatus Cloacimonadota bacterium]|nr:right-handed parallel beta-helix repeat-containing protein [Candidatus Cloacimonadota bacterium]
ITNISGGYVQAIDLEGPTPNAVVSGNTIDNLTSLVPNSTVGVYLSQYNDVANTITMHNNKFTGMRYGVVNAYSSGIAIATMNWWGDATGPFHATTNLDGLGCYVSDNVTFDPWYANVAMTQMDSNAPVENVTQNTFYNTIQAAVNAANTGDLINIGAGTYAENVVVNTRLTLQGAGSDQTIITSTGTVLALGAGTDATNRMVIRNLKVTGGTTGISVSSYTTLENVFSLSNTTYGISLNPLTDLVITDCSFSNNTSGVGLRLSTGTPASNITITGSHFDYNSQGWYSESNKTILPALDNVNITNTTFNYNGKKGIYTDRLSNSTFDNISVIGSGCESNYAPGAGIDLNLKYQNFSNVTIKNSTISGCGVGNTNGVGLTIKARDDGSYASPQATLNNVIIDNVLFNGNKTGLTFGEPGQNNAGPTGVEIKNCTFNDLEMDINNFSTSEKDAMLNNTYTGAIDNFAIESRIYHKVDNSTKGMVNWIADTVYVPVTNTIQAAIVAATPGDEIVVAPGTYLESVTI